jgi:ATP-binding cassette subfamily B protein
LKIRWTFLVKHSSIICQSIVESGGGDCAVVRVGLEMTLGLLAAAVLVMLPALRMTGRAEQATAEYRRELGHTTSMISENARIQKLIRSFQLQHAVIELFRRRSDLLRTFSFRNARLRFMLSRIPVLSLVVLNVLVVSAGAWLACHHYLSVGTVTAANTIVLTLTHSVLALMTVIAAVPGLSASLKRLEELVGWGSERQAETTTRSAVNDEPVGTIELEGVSFSYEEGKPAVRNTSVSILPERHTAIVGPSGAGKSTLMALLLGLYEPQEGRMLFGSKAQAGGRSTVERIREQIGTVFQETTILNGTVADNIRIGKWDAAPEEIERAAEQAGLTDFIRSLPQEFDTHLSEDGANLSGGQRQKIAIARAILRNPRILILDEATSMLDTISEASVQQVIGQLAKDRTVITITHRLAGAAAADQIIVLKEGTVVESGTHDQLLANAGLYREMWDKQSGMTIAEDGHVEIDEQRLSRLPFFRSVPFEALRELKQLFNVERFEPGATFIRTGDYGDKLYLIVRGTVQVSKPDYEAGGRKQIVATLQDGDHFGEIALLRNVPRTADVTAVTHCIVLTLQRHFAAAAHAQAPGDSGHFGAVLNAARRMRRKKARISVSGLFYVTDTLLSEKFKKTNFSVWSKCCNIKH